jgi:uncharacterized protein YndB with AHSA1/START domain
MNEPSVAHSTFVIESRYPVAPDRVFAAFTDPIVKRRWFLGDPGEGVEGHEMDFRVGGRERSSRRMGENTPFPGTLLVNDTTYLDIVAGRRIVLAYSMILGDKRISASLATIDLLANGGGTELIFTDQGAYFEGSDGAQRREHGWRQLLGRLEHELASH